MTVRHLPGEQRAKALTYGVWGAFAFRFLALFFLSLLMEITWIKFLGGGYLVWIAVAHFFGQHHDTGERKKATPFGFWKTVLVVELMDIAFSVDSILAAVSVSKVFWIVFVGGILGITTMRFAAVLFIKLMEWFPRLEETAYLLISVLGSKLVIEVFQFEEIDFNTSSNPAFGIFWVCILASVFFGFSKGRDQRMT